MRRHSRDESRSAVAMRVDRSVDGSTTSHRVGRWKRRSLDGAIVALDERAGGRGRHRVGACRKNRQGVLQPGLRRRSGVASAALRRGGGVECSHEEQGIAVVASVGRHCSESSVGMEVV